MSRTFPSCRTVVSALDRFLACFVAFCLFLNVASFSFAAEPSLRLSVDPPQIYQGESARLVVSVVNAEPDQEPELKELDPDFYVQSLGASRSSSVRSFGGARVETKTIDFNYQLTPKKSGVFTINAPKIVVDGKELTTSPATLTVQGATQTDLVLLETSVSPSSGVYPLRPFEITLDVLIKEAPEKYRDSDLMSLIVQNVGAPSLTIPWLAQNNDALLPDVDLETWLDQILAKNYGFTVNNYRFSQSVFDLDDPFDFGFGFGARRSTYFLPKSERVERTNASGEKVGYLKYSFKRTVRATKDVALSFPGATLKGNFIDFTDEENPKSQTVYLATNPLQISVKSIPEENAPKDYVGVYGRITSSVDVDVRDVAVGDAFTLSLTLQGYGVFDAAKAPDLSKTLGVDGTFKVYQPRERAIENGTAFDYQIRPTKEGAQEIPPITISYFDVEQGKFIPLTSQAIPLNIRESLLSSDTNSDDEYESADQSAVDSYAERLAKQNLQIRKYASIVVFLLIGLGAVIGLFFGGRAFLRCNARRVEASNRRIIDAARKRLELGLQKIEESPVEGLNLARTAFLQLVRRRFVQSVEALTDAEIVAFLDRELERCSKARLGAEQDEKQKQTETLRRLRDFFQRAEQIRFAGARSFDDKFRREISELFERWVEYLKAQTKKLVSFAGVQKT